MSKLSNRKLGITALVLLGLVLIGASVYLVVHRNSRRNQHNEATQQTSYRDSTTGVEIKYSEQTTKAQAISEADRKNNIILRLTEQQGQTPVLITLRYESGLRSVATITKGSIIDIIMGNSEKALPQRFRGFRKETSRRYEHNGRTAGKLIFTYDSPMPNERIKQKLTIFVKDDDTAVYLAMQSKETDFGRVEAETFDPMAATLASR